MITIHTLTSEVFLKLLYLMPVSAVGFGLFNKFNWLIRLVGCEAALLVVSLATMVPLLNSGRYPGATGMEGIALFVMPAMYIASIATSFLVYGIVVWIAERR